MHFSREQIATLKTTPITDYLNSLGIQPVTETKGQLLYRSPLTGEQTPSFFVHPGKNVFNCFSSGERGDIIRLVSLLEKLAFKPALARLSAFDSKNPVSFSLSGLNSLLAPSESQQADKLILQNVRPLEHPALVRYVMKRCIPHGLVKRYLYEVRYSNENRNYFAVGFKTDKDSYVLRSEMFKGWLGESAIRTITVPESSSVDLFEGFFDFLSALAYNRQFRPERTTIILNSTANLKQALPSLVGTNSVNCYFDNDRAGMTAVEKLRDARLKVNDCSAIYAGYADFNEMLQLLTHPKSL